MIILGFIISLLLSHNSTLGLGQKFPRDVER